jgi:hypothetical protein
MGGVIRHCSCEKVEDFGIRKFAGENTGDIDHLEI